MDSPRSSSQTLFRAFIIVVAIGIVLAVVFNFQKKTEPQTPEGPQPVYAPPGELIARFPRALILDEQAEVSQSYSITYDPKLTQYSAVLISAEKPAELYDRYRTYFGSNGWIILNDTGAEIYGLYARIASIEANVTISPKNEGSEVNISYLLK